MNGEGALIVGLLSFIIGVVVGRLSKRNQSIEHIHRTESEDESHWWKYGRKPPHERDDEEDV